MISEVGRAMGHGLLSVPLQASPLKKMFKGRQSNFILFYRWKKFWIVGHSVHTYISPLQALDVLYFERLFPKEHINWRHHFRHCLKKLVK